MHQFTIECRCMQQLNVPQSLLGRAISCGGCGAVHRLIVGGEAKSPDANAPGSPGSPGIVPTFIGRLQIVAGPTRVGETFFLGGEYPIFIGKLPGKQIVLVGERVSRNHCKLMPTGKAWWIEDQNSTNGIAINGIKVGSKVLAHGDRLHMGDYDLVYLESFKDASTFTQSAQQAPSQSPGPSSENPFGGTLTGGNGLSAAEASADPVVDLLSMPSPVTNHLLQPAAEKIPEAQADEGYELSNDSPPASAAALPGKAGEKSPFESGVGGQGTTTSSATSSSTTCPSCNKQLGRGAQICAPCGIYIADGKPLLTPKPMNLDLVYSNAEVILRWLSWLLWIGLYPIASEAYGSRKPYTVWAIAVLTVIVSVWFWSVHVVNRAMLPSAKNLMLWTGQGQLKAHELELRYDLGYGDNKALEAKISELEKQRLNQSKVAGTTTTSSAELSSEDEIVAADRALLPEQRAVGTFHWYQLLTHALLHGGLMHIAGNLLFLLIFGSRVNALIGSFYTAIFYPILAVLSGWAHMMATAAGPPTPLVGASGAIMGLAGMYLILFPVYKVHMAWWVRFGLLRFFRLHLNIFEIRGFWVVLFYIAFDVAYTAFGVKDNVAHWAHLGGFISGMVLAIALLMARQVNAHGGDLLSVTLGKRAWPLIGKPSQWLAVEMPAMPGGK